MLKIGYFARIGQVTVKALHHYGQMGLLKPAHIDTFTNYRYYTIDQLPQLNRILALKALGLSLEQITQFLNGDISITEIEAMLQIRKGQLEEQANSVATDLKRVEARLRQIEMENRMPELEIILKTTDPMLVASQRVHIPTNDQVPAILGAAFDKVDAYLKAQGVQSSAPCFAMWHSLPETYVDEDVEAIFPLERPVLESETIKIYKLPSINVAAVVHHGDIEEFTTGHKTLLEWIAANGYRLAGAYREIYLDWQDHRNATTEIQFPIEKI